MEAFAIRLSPMLLGYADQLKAPLKMSTTAEVIREAVDQLAAPAQLGGVGVAAEEGQLHLEAGEERLQSLRRPPAPRLPLASPHGGGRQLVGGNSSPRATSSYRAERTYRSSSGPR